MQFELTKEFISELQECLNSNLKALKEDSLKDSEIEVDIYAEDADLTDSI